MAKREAAEGVNGRLSIDLDQDSIAPGEIICGMVRLGLLESIEAREPLAVVVQGREAVTWDEERGCSPVTNAFDKIFFQHKIELSPDAVYEAGESEHPFELQLPTDLPSSFELLDIYSETAERLRVQIKYQVSVWLRSNRASVAYLTSEQEFTVHNPSTSAPPARALEISASEVVHWLYCVTRGDLQMTVTIPNDVSVAGQVVPLQCCVDTSACKAPVKSISVELVEDVVIQHLGEQPDWTVMRVLSTEQFAGLEAGCVRKLATNVKFVENEKQSPVNADVDAHFFQCSHRVIVRCKPRLAPPIVCEVPVRVQHYKTPFRAGSTRLQRMPAEVMAGHKSP
uniref:Arrestin C-terminal-like domain-containing protein n=1 Tax=Peronospora matthiolae TaxID=2874970 RepID=A0AAV1U8W4_9STRA